MGITQCICTKNKGIVRAIELEETDVFVTLRKPFKDVAIRLLDEPITTYNLIIEDNEDYYANGFYLYNRGV